MRAKYKLAANNLILYLLIFASFHFSCKNKISQPINAPDIYITKEKIILFTSPDSNSPKLKEFKIGESFKIIETSNQLAKLENKVAPWVKIQSGELEGWVFGDYIPIELKEDLLLKTRFDDDERNEYMYFKENKKVEILFHGEGCGEVKGDYLIEKSKIIFNFIKPVKESCENNFPLYESFKFAYCSIYKDYMHPNFYYRFECSNKRIFYGFENPKSIEKNINGIEVITVEDKINYTPKKSIDIFNKPDINAAPETFNIFPVDYRSRPEILSLDDDKLYTTNFCKSVGNGEFQILSKTKNKIDQIYWYHIIYNLGWYEGGIGYGWIKEEDAGGCTN